MNNESLTGMRTVNQLGLYLQADLNDLVAGGVNDVTSS